jgi:putative membrane-bound dehydrogenase-like protein
MFASRYRALAVPLSAGILGTCMAAFSGVLLLRGDEPARTGPQTEKRFPPLKLPAGFKATLFACDPLIEYPSVISAGPKPGALFVAVDYLTGLGTAIVRRDEIRLVEDSDGDGYADKATVFAQGFNSIQGLAYSDGTLYVMHAPFLTALRDTKGGGVADERRDLLSGLGLTPEQNPVRLHCANGVVAGHDGWLYLAMGDNGVNVTRPEGDRLVLHGGGILRCRLDGRDLHVFATGLRNIYDAALDAELNVFVRDNENDGGTYMIRVCHSFHGADHGYPYLYEEHPDEALPPLADLGLGSSAGGLYYLERQFPPEYRGDLFFCEWGRSVVRYHPQRTGGCFAPLKEIEFAAGAANDPYGFKPTDLVVQRDGTLMVSDWADGQRPKRGRGRIYHIASNRPSVAQDTPQSKTDSKEAGPERWLAQLRSESYYERCDAQAAIERLGREGQKVLTEALAKHRLGTRGRLHAIWALTHLAGPRAIDNLVYIARSDPDASVRAQAVRAVADLADPIFTRHRLDAGPGDADLAGRLAALGKGQDRQVLLEVILALGRLRWLDAPNWLRQHLGTPDAALAHAAMQTLRRSANWPAILKLLDESSSTPLRILALRAIAERFEPLVVDGLIQRLDIETDPSRRQQYAEALTRVYRKPGPWVYWGYRPAPRPANTVAWERTETIAQSLDRVLADRDPGVRLAVLRRMQREKVPIRLATLGQWLKDEYQPDRVAAILTALTDQSPVEVRPYVEAVVRDRRHSAANRCQALALFVRGLDGTAATSLLALAQTLEDGPVLADALRRVGKYPNLPATPVLLRKLSSPEAEVRAAAIAALGEFRAAEGCESVHALLQDPDVRVRRAAAGAARKLAARQAIEPLLKLMTDADAAVRCASLDALCRLREPRAVPLAVAAFGDRQVELTALKCLGELGGPEQASAVTELAKGTPSAEVLSAAVHILTAWRNREGLTAMKRQELDHAVAEVHGANGILTRWSVRGPVPAQDVPAVIEHFAPPGSPDRPSEWQPTFATGTEARVSLGTLAAKNALFLAYTDVAVSEPSAVEFLASSSGSLQVWLNGGSLYRRDQPRNFQIDSDRFPGTLVPGINRLFVQVGPAEAANAFHLRFRRKSATAAHERLTQAALSRPGNPEQGRKLFFDAAKSLCLKCHRLGEQGERIGPDLTGVGGRFARIYLIESILAPSRTIAPSFATLVLALKNGQVLTGVKIAETETTLTLADNQGEKHLLAKADIEEHRPSPLSTMPEGLEKRFTEEEFIDLVAFLVSQKNGRAP